MERIRPVVSKLCDPDCREKSLLFAILGVIVSSGFRKTDEIAGYDT